MSVLPVKNNKVQLTETVGTVYQNGVLMDGEKATYATASPVTYSNGIQRTATGAIYCVDATAGLPAGYTWCNGLPFSILGALCISNNAVASWSNGIPFDVNGAVVADYMPTPVLSLDFTTGTLDSRITFTRASGGTRVNSSGNIELMTTNTPRFDYDPVTLAAKGLLIEEQRTNLALQSEDFLTTWALSGATVTANTNISPKGDLTADSIVEDTSSGNAHRVAQTFAINSTAQYTVTCYLKASGRNWARLYIDDGGGTNSCAGFFNLSTGIVGSAVNGGTASGATVSMTNVGNGWYRCALTGMPSSVNTSLVRYLIGGTTGDTVGNYTGTGVTSVIAWGAQLEAGSFATSYIPTTTAQATRAADVAVMTGTNFSSWYNQSEGTVYTQYSYLANTDGVANNTVFAVDDTTANERMEYRRTTSGYTGGVITDGGVVQVNQADNAVILLAGITRKSAIAYKLNDVALSSDGTAVTTDTVATIPTVTQMQIGASVTNGRLNGHIKAIKYFNTRLPDSQLQTLTV